MHSTQIVMEIMHMNVNSHEIIHMSIASHEVILVILNVWPIDQMYLQTASLNKWQHYFYKVIAMSNRRFP